MLAGPVAVPESATVCGLPAALSEIESDADFAPKVSEAAGENFTLTLQLVLTAKPPLPIGHAPAADVIAKSAVFAPPSNTLEIFRAALPMFLTVTCCVPDELP